MTTRLLAVLGSGETAPTMVKVHRAVVAAAGTNPPGILLDTPFGFQLNADDLAARAVSYFERSVGAPLAVAGARVAADFTGRAGDALSARLAAAPFVFSGPGSPTYALGLWRHSLVPGLLRDKLLVGGAVTFASAAALTLGAYTVPVYEIYKAGEAPRWEAGLDLLRAVDPRLHVAVVPHFDNAEGGTHDTRFCYLGEPRLAHLEAELPDDAWVLGVDEHTALLLDLAAATATVTGLGGVTVRVRGRSEVLPSGTVLALQDLLTLPETLRRGPAVAPTGGPATPPGGTPQATSERPTSEHPTSEGPTPEGPTSEGGPPGRGPAGGPLLRAGRHHQASFADALAAGDARAMADAVLALEDELWAWRTDPTQTDEQDRVRAVLRAMVAELGTVAEAGTRDPAGIIAPYVELALDLRTAARAAGRFAEADAVRDALVALGVEARDSPDGTTWVRHGTEG